jgi:hypothetical protein
MARMGHSTARAALIYQRARREREREMTCADYCRPLECTGFGKRPGPVACRER